VVLNTPIQPEGRHLSERSERRFRVFVLGAGFSAAAALPLAPELWTEIRRRARAIPAGADDFARDVERYLEFRRSCDGDQNLNEDDVDFELFMSFLDVEHFLGLQGSDTWSVDGSRSTMVVKWLLGEILTERTPAPKSIPDCYLEFARNLQPDDYVLTFNYDVLLERALARVGKPYRLFPNRYETIGKHLNTVDSNRKEVVLLKLHGSVDWFDRAERSALEREHGPQSVESWPHLVFNRVRELAVTSIDDGPRPADDPFGEMCRVGNVDLLYEIAASRYATGIHLLCAPWLLAPSTMKIVYADKIREFWYGLYRAGHLNYGMAVVGYSLPSQDEYARQAIYALVRNYQESSGWKEEVFGLRKSPLVLVDLCPDDASLQQFRNRYRFVNWDRARLIRSGFDSEAVTAMFCSQ